MNKKTAAEPKKVDYSIIRRRLLPNAPLEYWENVDFDKEFSDRKIKDAIFFRMSKSILVGPSCFKCNWNFEPNNARAAICGLPAYLSRSHCMEPMAVQMPKKAVCDFWCSKR